MCVCVCVCMCVSIYSYINIYRNNKHNKQHMSANTN